jgi:CRISPR system Cascade subunit CasB
MSDATTENSMPNIRELGIRAKAWWNALQPGTPTADRAALARLRRATTADAMAHEATIELFHHLGYDNRNYKKLPRVATLACILAHVREHNPGLKFANAIGRSSLDDADSAALKPIRFQGLVTADLQNEDEIARAFRRALAIAGDAVDVADLARIILTFDSDETRRRLTFDYFGAGIAAPTEVDDAANDEVHAA